MIYLLPTEKAVRLPDFKFFNRFRLRIILQNKSSYLTLFIGIFFANVLLLFGMMMKPLLDHYQEENFEEHDRAVPVCAERTGGAR